VWLPGEDGNRADKQKRHESGGNEREIMTGN
jgi:hypothetical protein